jgi:acetoin:2,6-dichlorophenolindophenol oxidoreductase subunit alpha
MESVIQRQDTPGAGWAEALDRVAAETAAYQPVIAEWQHLLVIRRLEERLLDLHRAGEVAGAIHPCIGQEAVSVGVMGALRDEDAITVTFRGHGHALARGVPAERVAGEVLGRTTGACGGRGGSMVIIDQERGLIMSSAIVAGAVPAAVGAALAAKRRGEPAIAVAFFGDGATGQGVLYESMLLASLWRLPIVFVCENNLYSEMTPLTEISPVADGLAAALSGAVGMPDLVADGNSVRAVRAAALVAAGWARAGRGPVFLEARTYRLRGHYSGDPEHYRSAEEVARWRERDPLADYERELAGAGMAREDIEAARTAAEDETGRAIEAALAAPRAGEEEL